MKTSLVLLIALSTGSAFAARPACYNHGSSEPQQSQKQSQQQSQKDTNVNVNQNHSNSDSNSRSNSDSNSASRSSAQGGSSAVLGSGNSDNHNSATGGRSSSTSAGGAGGSSTSTANGGTAQGGSATGGSVGDTSTNGTVSNSNNYQQVRQAPSAYAPDALPSAPCRVSGSIGASSPFGGLSAGGSKLDAECDRRETARAFALLGNKLAAARILCNSKAAKEAQLTYQECANYAEGFYANPPVQEGGFKK